MPVLDRSRIEPIAGRANFPTRPQPPRNVVATPGSLQVTLTWNAPADTRGIVGYRFYQDNVLFDELGQPRNPRLAAMAAGHLERETAQSRCRHTADIPESVLMSPISRGSSTLVPLQPEYRNKRCSTR